MSERIDDLRRNALDRARSAETRFHLAVAGLLTAEALLVVGYLLTANLREPLHLLILIAAGIVYVPLVFGLVALGAHMNRCTWRIVSAMGNETRDPDGTRPA
ncbi:MAG: hypothetical protein ACXW31_04700 [Thermoanaerobaculia bacterium]